MDLFFPGRVDSSPEARPTSGNRAPPVDESTLTNAAHPSHPIPQNWKANVRGAQRLAGDLPIFVHMTSPKRALGHRVYIGGYQVPGRHVNET